MENGNTSNVRKLLLAVSCVMNTGVRKGEGGRSSLKLNVLQDNSDCTNNIYTLHCFMNIYLRSKYYSYQDTPQYHA